MTKRSPLLATAAVALSAVVAVGLPSSASAAPGGKGPKPAPTKVVKVAKADKQLVAERRKVTSLASAKNAALIRAAQTVSRSSLTVGEPEVLANIAADRTAVAALNADASSATSVSAVRLVGAQVRAVRPEVYSVVVNGLRQAVHLQDVAGANTAAIADLTAQADAKELEGYDTTAVRDLLASATLANDEATTTASIVVDQGLSLTAFSTLADRDTFTGNLEATGTLLDTVEAQLLHATDALTAMVPSPDPALDEDPTTEPVA